VGKPNFVQLIGFSDSPHRIITDYYSLGNLERALLRKRVVLSSKRISINFSLQISRALALRFAHADIKAMNVLVDRGDYGEYQCFIGDFGLAQVLDDTHLVVKAYRVFNLKGLTAVYAAPEVLERLKLKTVSITARPSWLTIFP
jgi:serine/threonine protein kinase